VAILGAPLVTSAPVWAQEIPAAAPDTAAVGNAFSVQGSASVGYRTTDVTGYEPKYRELYNLRDGWRLTEFTLFSRAPIGNNRFADNFAMTASGLGGDPFQSLQVTARRHGLYDFRASYRRSSFYWDQSDATLPTGKNGLTNNHSWDTTRNLGNVSFLLHPSSTVHVGFELSHADQSGTTVTTRAPDFFGSPAAWGSFARANPFSILAPMQESTNRYTGNLDVTRAGWTLHYRAGYQEYFDSVTANAAATPERSINIDDPATAKELLQQGSYQDYRRLTTPVSEFSYDGRLSPRLHWRGGYLFYRYEGPAGLQALYSGAARSNATGTQVANYNVALDTRAEVKEPIHVLDQGATWEVSDILNVLVDYRYEHIGIDSSADFTSVYNTAINTGDTVTNWTQKRNQIDADVEVMPGNNVMLRGGVRFLFNNVRVLEDGTVDDARTKDLRLIQPTFSGSWTPSSVFNVRGDFDSMSNRVSYTRLMPNTEYGSRLIFSVRPTEQLSIVEALILRHQSVDISDYTADTHDSAITATYQMTDDLAMFGGYTYDSFKSEGNTTFLRGNAPLTDLIINDATSNVWQGGLSAKVSRIGGSVAGNYVHTTGQGSITGEPPLYGPLSHRYVTATVFLDVPGRGRLSFDWTRTRYFEELVPLNDFWARIIMVRWTQRF
jgi:hypothetical protein